MATVDLQGFLLEATVTQDLPRQLDQIQGPEPFDIGSGPDVLDDHLADHVEFAPAFAGQQTG